MNILFSVFRYHTNMYSMVLALKQAGHEVQILVVAREPYEDFQPNLVKLIDSGLSIQKQIKVVFDQFSPDLVIVRDALNEVVAPTVAKLSNYRKIKCLSYEQNPCYHKSLLGAAYLGVRHVFYQLRRGLPLQEISPKRGALSGHRIPFRKYFLFPMLSDDSRTRMSYIPNGVVRIVSVGKLGVERKRLDWVISALESSGVEYHLTLVGANDLDKYPNRSHSYYKKLYELSRLGIAEGRIKIRENVPFDQMSSIYQNSDVFVLAARDEKFGISPLEAMSHGCAVMCANDNGSSPYLSSGVDSLVFDSSSFQDFQEKLYKLLNNGDMIISLGTNAKKAINERHNLVSFANFTSDLVM